MICVGRIREMPVGSMADVSSKHGAASATLATGVLTPGVLTHRMTVLLALQFLLFGARVYLMRA